MLATYSNGTKVAMSHTDALNLVAYIDRVNRRELRKEIGR